MTAKQTRSQIKQFLKARVKEFENLVYDQLEQVGEQFVADARSINTYLDRTRNLRGSIGYVIVKDGRTLTNNFQGESEGMAKAKRLVGIVKENHSKGYALIVVAGMEYAAYVEARGYDVITGSSDIASARLRRAFTRLQAQLSRLR